MKFSRLPLLLLLLIGACAYAKNVVLVPASSDWRYLADGSDPGTAWLDPKFRARDWHLGKAELGYGNGDETTLIPALPGGGRPVTTYFHKVFTVSNPTSYSELLVRLMRDAGAVVYLNGVEIVRSNVGAGPVNSDTPALTDVYERDGGTFYPFRAPKTALVRGINVLAVELHQPSANGNNGGFDCELVATTLKQPAFVGRGPYLQNVSSTAATIRWRTDVPTTGLVKWGRGARSTRSSLRSQALTTEHELRITGLLPDTVYYYALGAGTDVLEGNDKDHWFRTLPVAGTAKAMRFWVIGDSGTGGDGSGRAERVRDAYLKSPLFRHADGWLMLGDNAYGSGTDSEHQAAVFETYRKILPNTPLWPTLGNHETYTVGVPYFDIFTLPTAGEAGGLPSGTEHYYSFDFGNIHFVCLDSMESSRQPGSPMLTWLENDLSATTQPWIIAYWHHPPYSRGTHNSDLEGELIEMRQYVLPILENYGVDLVLSGHSHSYERSFLIDGHYGPSNTLNASMVRDGGDGRIDGSGAYTKSDGAHRGAVYTVCGVSGQTAGGSGGTLNYPSMFLSLSVLGSLALDIDGDRLDAHFIDSTGVERDHFTLRKTGP